jgi:hypothetical protein
VPLEDVLVASLSGTTQHVDASAVNVIYGSTAGLTSTDNRFWHQNIPGVDDAAQPGDRFGQVLY